VKQPLVVRPRPAALVKRLERPSTRCHSLEARRDFAFYLGAALFEGCSEHRWLIFLCKVRVVLVVDLLKHLSKLSMVGMRVQTGPFYYKKNIPFASFVARAIVSKCAGSAM
jgi:hypothetical protein